MKLIEPDKYELSTGRQFYANRGILGLGTRPGSDDWSVFEGYDGGVDVDGWNPAEYQELADHMIEQWRIFGQRHGKPV